MTILLKQSVAKAVSLGPFVDKTDGVTPESGLVSAIDDASTGIKLSKNGGALTIRNATVTASTYDGYGNYIVTLDATDTNTLGTLRMQFIETATCLPVWMDFMVVPATVYDAIVTNPVNSTGGLAGATGAITGLAGVIATTTNITAGTITTATSVTTVNGLAAGVITAASIAADAITAAKIADGAIDAATFAAGAINAAAIDADAITDAKVASDVTIASVTGAVGSVTAAITLPTIPTNWITADGIAADAIGSSELAASAVTEIQSGLATSASIATLQSDTDDIQARLPAALVSGRIDASVGAMAANTLTAAALATDAVSEIQTGLATPTNITAATGVVLAGVTHTGAVIPTVSAVTGLTASNLDVASSTLATAANLATVAGYLDTEIAAIKTVTDAIGATGSGLSAIPWNAAWDAEVQSEVDDALVAQNLDHLVKIAVDTDFATTVHLNSVIGNLADNGTSATFDRTTDSLEAIRDRGDTAWGSSGGLTQADVRTAVGLASANLDTQLSAIDDFLDTEVAAIKAKTDNLPSDPADASDIASSFATVNTKLDTIDDFLDTEVAAVKAKTDQLTFTVANQVDSNVLTGGGSGLDAAATRAALGLASANLDTQLGAIDDYLDTELAAVKAKTDNLPADPADASDIAAAFSTVNTKLDTIDDFLDTELAAVKAKTDNLPSDPADQSAVEAAITAATSPLASQASVNDLPTNAELATALGTSDDATLAAIAALNNISTAQVNAEVDTALADVGLTTTITGRIDDAVSTRLSTAGYTAPDNASIVAAAADAAELNDTKITTVRAAVLSDWIDGGRLDLILDAIPTTIRMKKNTAFTGFTFPMFDADDLPLTGLTVTATRSIDAGSFAACANAVSEVGSGVYKLDLSAGDLNGNDVMLKFSASGAKTTFIKIVMQP